MRIDLPLCGFKYCKYSLDGNCTAKEIHRERCDFLNAPTIEPVKRGEWNGWTTSAFIGIDEENEPRFADRKFYRCGDCRYGSVIKTNFCPNCGTDMRAQP